MSKLRYYLDVSTLKKVYYSLIYLHIQHCIFVGDDADLKQIVCMQKD